MSLSDKCSPRLPDGFPTRGKGLAELVTLQWDRTTTLWRSKGFFSLDTEVPEKPPDVRNWTLL